jgi:hypothetical protein
MLRQFSAELQRGNNKGAWTYVVMPDSVELRTPINIRAWPTSRSTKSGSSFG